MKKLTLAVVAVAAVLFLSAPVFAFGPGCAFGAGPGGGPGYHREANFAKLNLTDEQKAKLESLQIAQQKEIRPIREKMFDKSVELRRMWLQVNPDKDKIIALQKEVRELRNQLEDKATVQKLEIRKLLTTEQQEKLVNSGWGRGKGFGPRGGMRGAGGPGPGICY
ncbi:MAG TPA: Spy/CpxP family protein refolding chaperone [Smithellaceae bacterium]|nr:Spy/CpxP family protein refolding chaperone [Smithellaceae bacterium]